MISLVMANEKEIMTKLVELINCKTFKGVQKYMRLKVN